MAAGSDLLDDLFADVAVKTARPVGKFQPKAKFKPARKNTAATSVSSSSANQSSDNAPSKSTEPVKNAEPSDNNDPRPVSLSHVKDSSKVIRKANASLQPNLDMVTEQHESSYAHTEKSAGENADTVIHLESLDDLVLQGTTTDMGAVPHSDVVSVYVPNPENTRGSDVPVISDSTYTNNVPEVLTCLQVLEEGDPITASRCEGGVSLNDRECEREEMSVMDSIDFSELTTTPVQKTGKFQPKRKVQMRKEVPVISSMESGPTPPEINSAEKDSVPDFVGDDDDDDVLDLSSIGLTDGAPTEETSEPPLNEEESMNLMEDVPEFPAKLVSRRAKIGTSEAHVASNVSMQQQNARPSGQDNEITDRMLRPRKNKISFCELDEAEDVDNRPASSAAEEEDNYADEQFEQEGESKVKKTSRKSRKPDEDIEKPSKKREKAKEALDGKPKKFFRSTRRRRVDKALLETPEDEIDYQQVPLRDLIRLAEHKEKQMNKEEAAAKPAIKQSNGNSSAFHYENETYTSREDEENNDEQENLTVQDMNYFNYQTYMDKTPTIRWSKQDTELFYEAVRQFGTDLSMIQHLFPGRTRHQIKLKYKKEEKQNPFRLHDALTTRTKDVSHFQKVIDRLKQIAAEEKQNADEDESMGLSGDDEVAEEETSLANDEEAKNEEIEREENEDVPQEIGNPEEAYDSEEDMLLWSQYKSNT